MNVLRSARQPEPVVRSATIEGWKPALMAVGVAVLVFAIGFHRDGADAVRVWIASTAYNHCFLVLPVVGYLLWERRAAIAASSPRPTFWPLALMPVLSAVWLLAAALDINEGRQLLVVAMFEVVLLCALGQRVYRLLLAPLLFLFFLVPTGASLVPWLQSVTADIAVAGLRLFHIPVFSDGYMIDIPEGSFEIAEACAGLRFLIAASVFSCFFAVLMYRGWLRRILYIALSIVTAIFANGLRALGIIALAHLLGSATAVEADHVIYGWLFFSLVIALLIAIGLLMTEKGRQPEDRPATPVSVLPPRWRALAAPLVALIALAGPAYAAWQNVAMPRYSLPQTAGPGVAAPWQAQPDQIAGWRPMVLDADREFLETFVGPGSAKVTRYVALYRLGATGNRLTRSENRIADDHRWRLARQGRTAVSVRGKRVEVRRSEIIGGAQRRLVWSFYVVDGKIAAGLFEAKLLQLRAVLLQRRPLGAFVAIAASMDDPDNSAAVQLTHFLAASEPFPNYLETLRREAEPAS